MAGDVVLGLDLGGTKLLGIVLDPAADPDDTHGILAQEKVPTPKGTDAVGDALCDLGRTLVAKAADELGRQVVAVGLGAPGLVDRTGTLRYGPNLPGVVDCDFATLLSDGLGVPAAIDNDATCAAWGEHERGAAKGKNHSITITLGTGIGAGITVKGEVLRGAHGFAGEPGHMVVDPHGPRCPCGRKGCWERFASGSGLGWLAREAAVAGLAARVVEIAGGDPNGVKGEHVTQAADEGDAQALQVFERYAWWVALGVANLVNVLDSEIVVLGGGMVEAADHFLEPARRHYRDLVLAHEHRDEVPIVRAQLGEQAGAIGAGLLAAARVAPQ